MPPNLPQLPVESDFLDPRSRDLDERYALKEFLGKTPEQAEEMFRQSFIGHYEDLMAMRAPAFRFYVLPAVKYLLSDAADSDAEAVSLFCRVLECRLERDRAGIEPIRTVILDAVQQIIGDFARYDYISNAFGDVVGRYRKLARQHEEESG